MPDSTITGAVKTPRNISQYSLMRGATDWGNLKQFNQYESGYSFLFLVEGPNFLEKLAGKDPAGFGSYWNAYKHMLEYEFRGLDGLENVTADTLEITNGINSINVINKVNMQSASTISMRYFEKSGGLITRVHEKFLTGIKDPRTQIKTYHGLIKDGTIAPANVGYENEVFTFLYVVTDNTAMNVERAFLLMNSQPTSSTFDIYNSEKGTIENKEISVEFNCFPVSDKTIDAKAQELINRMNTDASFGFSADSSNFDYSYGSNSAKISSLDANTLGNTVANAPATGA